jgi:pimeloyl-ACP methyl ester carboxylesterase
LSADAELLADLPRAEGFVHRFVEAGRVRFHVAEIGAGTPVVLLHGFPQHWWAWRHVAPALAAAGYHVACPDLRGAGWSDAPASGYTSADRVTDLLALLDALELDRVALIGHEWGARTGFLACLRAPERFSHFLALNAVHPWPNPLRFAPHAWRFWFTAAMEAPGLGPRFLRRPAFVRFLLRHGLHDPQNRSAADMHEFVRRAVEPDRARAGAALHRLYARHELVPMLFGRYRFEHLRTPTVLAGGKHDTVLPPSTLTGGERHANDLRLETVPGSGRFLPEEQPGVVVALATELFEARAARDG